MGQSDPRREFRIGLAMIKLMADMRQIRLRRPQFLQNSNAFGKIKMSRVRTAAESVKDNEIQVLQTGNRIFIKLLTIGDISYHLCLRLDTIAIGWNPGMPDGDRDNGKAADLERGLNRIETYARI